MIWNAFLLALRAIRRNKMRSFLTILGIVIGVAAVITMVTLGDGATEQVRADISSLGSNMLQIRPGQGFRGPGGVRIAAERFKIADVHAIEREIYGLAKHEFNINSTRQLATVLFDELGLQAELV